MRPQVFLTNDARLHAYEAPSKDAPLILLRQAVELCVAHGMIPTVSTEQNDPADPSMRGYHLSIDVREVRS